MKTVRHWAFVVFGVALVAGLEFSVALTAARNPSLAVELVGGTALLVIAVVFPRALLVMAPVATMFPQRVGPAILNLSVTDAVGLLAALAALRYVPWHDRRIRTFLAGLFAYLALLAVSLAAHHPQRALLEWGHRGVLVAGSIFVGVAIVRGGLARPALRLFTLATAILAVSASLEALRTGFEPAYVFQLQKNHAGVLLAAGFVVVFAARRTLAWHPHVIRGLQVLMLVGLAATQSRASALGVAVALAVRPLVLGRRGNQRAASVGVIIVCLALLGLTAASVKSSDLSRPVEEQKFNSINTRTDVYEQAIRQVWLKNRFVGGGLRYFNEPGRYFGAPHNLVISEMAEAGLVGLAGLIALLVALVLALRRSDSDLVVMGAMALSLRVTQGLADIFWVAGPLTIALILAGMGMAEDRADAPAPGEEGVARSSSRVQGSAPVVAKGLHP